VIRTRRLLTVAFVAPLLATAVGCGGDDTADEPEVVDVSADRCVVRLHGKGAQGAPSTVDGDGVAVLSPDGNGTGWGSLQWDYDTDAGLEEATGIITETVDQAGCERVVVHGFSNGAAMAAAWMCTGDDLDGRLAGVIIDDPVTDESSDGCMPADVPVAIYWTGALDVTGPQGTECDSIDWTCDGDVVRGIDAYAADIGVEVTPSPYEDHRWYVESALPLTWLA
jgi:pimeloyl-ACP methyl ester carboxylesterase